MAEGKSDHLTVTVSRENSTEFLEAVFIASRRNDVDGAGVSEPKARSREGLRRIIIDWLLENRRDYWESADEHERAELDALSRDGFRCKRCDHSRIGEGGCIAVGVITHGMIQEGTGFPLADARNMVTLCRPCAEEWNGLPLDRRMTAAGTMLRGIGPDTDDHHAWVERVVGILLQPEACQTPPSPQSTTRSTSAPASPSKTGSQPTKPPTGPAPTLPR